MCLEGEKNTFSGRLGSQIIHANVAINSSCAADAAQRPSAALEVLLDCDGELGERDGKRGRLQLTSQKKKTKKISGVARRRR